MEKAILAAIDGSVASAKSLDYLTHLFAADTSLAIHLLNVTPSSGAGKEWMNEVDPLRMQTMPSGKNAQMAHRQLQEAKERLLRKGIHAERIHSHVKPSLSGTSNSIRAEAERGGYDAVIVGRRGLGAMGSMFLGSVSSELVERSHQVPLWIVDGEVTSSRFLLAVQSHPSSLMAADHLGFIARHVPNLEVCLYHSESVFGKQQPARAEDFHQQWGKSWCDQYLDLENFLFFAHAQLLQESGIPRHRIVQLPAQMHLDVSADLLRQAKQHRCGTIVLGRRRRDAIKGQIKGVSDKTVKQAQNIAIWLAG